jgi:tRNA/rRNA methyltransferase
MNLGQAVAVCLYEIVRVKNAKGSLRPETSASLATAERITETLLAALRESEYINPKTSQLAEEKLRRMLRRFNLEAADADVFLGMLHKISWKLNQNKRLKN